MSEHVQIFSEDSFLGDDRTWGWQCFVCRAEETGLASASVAGEGRDKHAAICSGRPEATP